MLLSLFMLVLTDSEMITSFSNPNYTLSNDDALNSNQLPPPPDNTTQYYDTNLYDDIADISTTNTAVSTTDTVVSAKPNVNLTNSNASTRKNRSKYAKTDLSQMGLGITGTSASASLDSLTVTSPVESEGRYSVDSGLTSPADGLVSVEHSHSNEEQSDGSAAGNTGFTGFYATAHESAHLLAASQSADRSAEAAVTNAADDVRKPLLSVTERLQR